MEFFGIKFLAVCCVFLLGVLASQTDGLKCIDCHYSTLEYNNTNAWPNLGTAGANSDEDCLANPEKYESAPCPNPAEPIIPNSVARCIKADIMIHSVQDTQGYPTTMQAGIQMRACQQVPADSDPGDGKWSIEDIRKAMPDVGKPGDRIEAEVYACSTDNCNAAITQVSALSIGNVLLITLVSFFISK